MSRRTLKLVEMRSQATEALGVEPGLDLELNDGSTVTVPHPLLLDGETQQFVEEHKTSTVASAKAVLGEKDYIRLIEGGGSANDVMLAWSLMSKDMVDKMPTTGVPTQSSTS